MEMLMVFLIFAGALAYFGISILSEFEKNSPQSNLDIMYRALSQQEKEAQKRTSRETIDVMREILGMEEAKEEVVYPPDVHTLSYTLSQNWQKGQPVWQRTTSGWLKWVVQDLLPAKKADSILSDDVNSRLLLLLEKDKRVNTFKLGDITAGMLAGTWQLKEPKNKTNQPPAEREEQPSWILKAGNDEEKRRDAFRTHSGVPFVDANRIEVKPLLWHRDSRPAREPYTENKWDDTSVLLERLNAEGRLPENLLPVLEEKRFEEDMKELFLSYSIRDILLFLLEGKEKGVYRLESKPAETGEKGQYMTAWLLPAHVQYPSQERLVVLGFSRQTILPNELLDWLKNGGVRLVHQEGKDWRECHPFKPNPMRMAAICDEDSFYQMLKFLREGNEVYGGLEIYTSMTRAFQPIEVSLIQESGSLEFKHTVQILMQMPVRPFSPDGFNLDGRYQKRGFRIPFADFQKQFAAGSIRERREE